MRGGSHFDGGSGRAESLNRPARGEGVPMRAKCDECQEATNLPRRRAKVLAGALRGLFGMVCMRCAAKREKAA